MEQKAMTTSSQRPERLACPKCRAGELRRLNRVGFLERTVLHSLGIYPWECVLCRKKTYCRSNGHAAIAQRTAQKSATQKSAG